MDREMFRRMAVEWVSEMRLAHLRLLGTFCRPGIDGGASPW